MDFMNRGAAQPAAPVRPATSNGSTLSTKKASHWKESPTWLRVLWVVLLFLGTILLLLVATLLHFGATDESSYINKSKQQAVFLTNGQVYFGKVKSVNKNFLDLQNIYYLNVNQQVQPNQKDSNQAQNISLVKLGCELHGPIDQMVINRSQVTFWENLRDDGQVAKAIAQWNKQNPNGQKCQTATTDSQNQAPSSSNSTSGTTKKP